MSKASRADTLSDELPIAAVESIRLAAAFQFYTGVLLVPDIFKVSASLCVLLSWYATLDAQDIDSPAAVQNPPSVDSPAAKPETAITPEEKSDGAAILDAAWMMRARRILEIGSEVRTTTEERTIAYKELAELKPKENDDPRLIYAFILVAMLDKHLPEAQTRAAEMLKSDTYYVPVRAANARLLLLLDKKLPAIAELESLAKGLGSPSTVVSQDQLVAAASFLGLAVGYLEGPAKESIKPTHLKALIAVAEKIPSSLLEIFSQSRAIIGEEYQVLVEKGEDALKELRTSTSKKADEMRAQLAASRDQTLNEVEATKQRLESSFERSQSEWNSAWSQSQAISRIANALWSQQTQFVTSLSLLRPPRIDEHGNVDRNDERRFLNEKRRLDNAIFDLETQLNQLSIQYDQLQSIGIAAENRMNALRLQGQRLGMNLSSQNESFAKMDRLIRGKEEAAKKAEAKTLAGRMRKARSFSTYDDFNFYKEQSLLLDALPKE